MFCFFLFSVYYTNYYSATYMTASRSYSLWRQPLRVFRASHISYLSVSRHGAIGACLACTSTDSLTLDYPLRKTQLTNSFLIQNTDSLRIGVLFFLFSVYYTNYYSATSMSASSGAILLSDRSYPTLLFKHQQRRRVYMQAQLDSLQVIFA